MMALHARVLIEGCAINKIIPINALQPATIKNP